MGTLGTTGDANRDRQNVMEQLKHEDPRILLDYMGTNKPPGLSGPPRLPLLSTLDDVEDENAYDDASNEPDDSAGTLSEFNNVLEHLNRNAPPPQGDDDSDDDSSVLDLPWSASENEDVQRVGPPLSLMDQIRQGKQLRPSDQARAADAEAPARPSDQAHAEAVAGKPLDLNDLIKAGVTLRPTPKFRPPSESGTSTPTPGTPFNDSLIQQALDLKRQSMNESEDEDDNAEWSDDGDQVAALPVRPLLGTHSKILTPSEFVKVFRVNTRGGAPKSVHLNVFKGTTFTYGTIQRKLEAGDGFFDTREMMYVPMSKALEYFETNTWEPAAIFTTADIPMAP
jgi:hypothetical protein